MPVIVVGADTPSGEAIVAKLMARGGEVRAFVASRPAAQALKQGGVKVAVGDLSDGSHVAAASFDAFTAVLVAAAATDGRPLGFTAKATDALAIWATAVQEASVRRAIWVGEPDLPVIDGSAPEVTVVAVAGKTHDEVAQIVADLDDREDLKPET